VEVTVAPEEFTELLFNFFVCHAIYFNCKFRLVSLLSKSILGDDTCAGSTKSSLVDQSLGVVSEEWSKLTVRARSASSSRELIRLLFPTGLQLVGNTKC
jgi:hypothetical protein